MPNQVLLDGDSGFGLEAFWVTLHDRDSDFQQFGASHIATFMNDNVATMAKQYPIVGRIVCVVPVHVVNMDGLFRVAEQAALHTSKITYGLLIT